MVRFALAKALWDAPPDAGRDRARALELAEQARTALMQGSSVDAKDQAQLDSWLRTHAARVQ